MGKFDGVLLCTDLDGTYTEGYDVCGDNLAAVNYFRREGGLFTVATGRLPPYLPGFGDALPTDVPVITHNGAVIYDTKNEKMLYDRPLFNLHGEVRETLRYIKTLDVTDHIDMNAALTWVPEEQALREDDTTVYYKGVVPCRSVEDALRLREALVARYGKAYCVFRAWNVGVEFLSPDTNKGTALRTLVGMLGKCVKRTVAVGDFENDAYMLREADLGVAVKNGSPEALTAADVTVCDFREGAVAEVIRLLEKEFA